MLRFIPCLWCLSRLVQEGLPSRIQFSRIFSTSGVDFLMSSAVENTTTCLASLSWNALIVIWMSRGMNASAKYLQIRGCIHLKIVFFFSHVNICCWYSLYQKRISEANLSTHYIQSTLVIANSKGLSETLRDIRTSKYQSCGSEETNKSNNLI